MLLSQSTATTQRDGVNIWPTMMTNTLELLNATTPKPKIIHKAHKSIIPLIIIGAIFLLLIISLVCICVEKIRHCFSRYCCGCFCCDVSETREVVVQAPTQPSSGELPQVVTTEPALRSGSGAASRRQGPLVTLVPSSQQVPRSQFNTSTRPSFSAARQVADTAKIIGNILTTDGTRNGRRK